LNEIDAFVISHEHITKIQVQKIIKGQEIPLQAYGA
jgi:hypothetical protein